MNKTIKPIAECKTLQELFADESRWAQDAFALTRGGAKVLAQDPLASCFCLLGGCIRLFDESRIVVSLIKKELGMPLEIWNDDPKRTVQDIQALVKKLNI